MRIHDDDHDEAPELPGREVLEAWTVPSLRADLAERVLDHVEAAMPRGEPVVKMKERRRGGLGLAVVGVAMVAAAALVLSLVQLWGPGSRSQEPPVVAAPIVVRVPVPVVVPATPPAVAVEPPAVAVEPPVVPAAEPVPAPEVSEPPRVVRAPELKDPFAGRGSEAVVNEDLLDPFEAKAKAKPKASAKTAVLRVGTVSGYGPAQVYVDGKSIGMTPVMNVKVTPGLHEVKWVWADATTAKTVVELEAGQTMVIKGPPSDLEDPYGGQ